MQTTKLDIGKFCNLKRLYELKVRSPNGLSLPPFSFSGGLQGLSELTSLKILVIVFFISKPSFFGQNQTNLKTMEVIFKIA